MKHHFKILPILITMAFLSIIDWNYFSGFMSLTMDAAMEFVQGGSAAASRLEKELDSLTVDKFIKLDIEELKKALDRETETEDNVCEEGTTEAVSGEERTTDTETVETTTEDSVNTIPFKDIGELPQNVQDAFQKYDKSGWKGNVPGQTKGTSAGGEYGNKDNRLPSVDSMGNPITYNEWDVNNKQDGMTRDGQRFVTGSDGSIYFTDSHYGEGTSPLGLPPFVRIR